MKRSSKSNTRRQQCFRLVVIFIEYNTKPRHFSPAIDALLSCVNPGSDYKPNGPVIPPGTIVTRIMMTHKHFMMRSSVTDLPLIMMLADALRR